MPAGRGCPASDILIYGAKADGSDLLGTTAVNATNGYNVNPANAGYGTYPYTATPYAFGVHGTSVPYSFHTGGVDFTLGDGRCGSSARTSTSTCSSRWPTPAGGEVVGEF